MNSTSDIPIRERFAQFQETDFCDWLSRGFKAFYAHSQFPNLAGRTRSAVNLDSVTSNGKESRPFDFAFTHVGKKESLLDDLEYIYDQYVPNEKKIVFRLSVGRLLRQCVGDNLFPDPGFSDLIYLMAKVRAHESLECLAPVLGKGRFGQERKWLQYEAIATLKALLPAKEAVEGLRNLVTLPNFSPAFSFDILAALCRADPERWYSAFMLLRGHIASLHKQAQEIGGETIREVEDAARDFVKSFVEFMPTSAIGDLVPQIDLTTSSRELYASGTWLVKELFTGDRPPLMVLHEDGTFTDNFTSIKIPIFVAKQPARRTNVLWQVDQYKTLRSISSEYDKVKLLHLFEDSPSVGQAAAEANAILGKLPFLARTKAAGHR